MFDFRRIIGPEDSKQENFSSLSSCLIMKIYPTAKPVDGKGGDEGVDTIIGEFNGPCKVFQHKYFIEKIGSSQRKQIEKSLKTALKHHDVEKWTLVIPKELNPTELRWFQKLQTKYSPVTIDWWGKTRLQNLLTEYPEIAREYQPSPIVNIILADQKLNFREVSQKKLATILGKVLDIPIRPGTAMDALMGAAANIRGRSKLKVLIFGPGPSKRAIYKKRCEIREQLTRLGHQADFAEDVWTPQALESSGLNLSVAEYLQAKAYDYIVCLMASPGSIGEVHDFAKDKKLASKMMICVDETHKSGYSAQGVLRIFEGRNGKLDWYESPRDVEECYLSGRVLQQIEKVSEAKQWELAGGGTL